MSQGRMLEFKHLFPRIYAIGIVWNRLLLRLAWAFWKPIRVRVADIWTFSAVFGAVGVILAILLFIFRGTEAAEAQQLLGTQPREAIDDEPAEDVDEFIPAALTANQPTIPEDTWIAQSSIPGSSVPQSSIPQSSIPVQPAGQSSPGIVIRQRTNVEATLSRTLLPAGWDQRETMEIVSVPNPYIEQRLFDPRDPWRLASFLPQSTATPFSSYVQRVGRIDAADVGPSLVSASEIIYAFDPVQASQNALVHVAKHVPSQVRRGESLTYDIEIQNLTAAPLESVVVRERTSALDRVEAVRPEANVVGDCLRWEVTLQPLETKWLQVQLRPNDLGELSSEVEVTVVSRIGAITQVSDPPIVEEPLAGSSIPDVEPSVAQQPAPMEDPFSIPEPLPPQSSIPFQPLHQPSPDVSMSIAEIDVGKVGREWSTTFVVSNTGDAPAYDVVIEVIVPPEFRHRHGRAIRHQIAELAPGATRRARLRVVAEESGVADFDAALLLDSIVVQTESLAIPIEPAAEVEQASFSRPARRSSPEGCPPVILQRPYCGW